jgi:hypothetical protein
MAKNIASGLGHVGLFADRKQSTKFLSVRGTGDSRGYAMFEDVMPFAKNRAQEPVLSGARQ